MLTLFAYNNLQLTLMKEQDQIKAIAELDTPGQTWANENEGVRRDYLHSYDAIIPVRKKVINTPALKVEWLTQARKIAMRRLGSPVSDFDIASLTIEEESEALLRATGKWIE